MLVGQNMKMTDTSASSAKKNLGRGVSRRAPDQRKSSVTLNSKDGFQVRVGDNVITVHLDYGAIKEGFEASLLTNLEKAEVLERDDIDMIIKRRTLERRLSNRERLKLEESDGIARLLRIIGHANKVFEDEELAEEWLRCPNPALDDEVPMTMARTDSGAREVEGVLMRLEFGVFD